MLLIYIQTYKSLLSPKSKIRFLHLSSSSSSSASYYQRTSESLSLHFSPFIIFFSGGVVREWWNLIRPVIILCASLYLQTLYSLSDLARKAGTTVATASTREKMLLTYNKQKKRETIKGNRILISVTFLGSAGPIRFVACEGDLVANVIDTALKCYAREGRLPILGTDFNDFLFYCPMVGPEALSPWEAIGSLGARNFMLCEKPEEEKKKVEEEDNRRSSFPINGARKGSFRAWIHKSFSLRVTTH